MSSDRAGDELKNVREFWERASCGEIYALGANEASRLAAQATTRYALEPYIREFARFGEAAGRDVLEVGVGMGADHREWARARPRSLVGLDLTPRALQHTRHRLAFDRERSSLVLADAEHLPLPDAAFDLVYSWGVLHHSPDTAAAIAEVHRVLRPGGCARIMIYQRSSIVGWLLWLKYGLARGAPLRRLDHLYAHHLESPGTKAYSVSEAYALFRAFRQVHVRPQLSFSDLLQGDAGARHGGRAMSVARALWPRALLKVVAARRGLYLLIDAVR